MPDADPALPFIMYIYALCYRVMAQPKRGDYLFEIVDVNVGG